MSGGVEGKKEKMKAFGKLQNTCSVKPRKSDSFGVVGRRVVIFSFVGVS